jgi:hypothetical protein
VRHDRGTCYDVVMAMALWMTYFFMGMGTATFLWAHMADEIELGIAAQMEEGDDPGPLRTAVTVFMLLAWPVAMVELVRQGRQ